MRGDVRATSSPIPLSDYYASLDLRRQIALSVS